VLTALGFERVIDVIDVAHVEIPGAGGQESTMSDRITTETILARTCAR
jgi:hypothetical protein